MAMLTGSSTAEIDAPIGQVWAFDPGRVPGMVIRGPLADLLRAMLVTARAAELKRAIESG